MEGITKIINEDYATIRQKLDVLVNITNNTELDNLIEKPNYLLHRCAANSDLNNLRKILEAKSEPVEGLLTIQQVLHMCYEDYENSEDISPTILDLAAWNDNLDIVRFLKEIYIGNQLDYLDYSSAISFSYHPNKTNFSVEYELLNEREYNINENPFVYILVKRNKAKLF